MNRLDDSRKGIGGVLATKEGGRAVATGLLLAILMLGMGLRLYELDSDSMWLDEIITANQASRDLLSAITHDENYTHPPLVDVVTWFFINISGNSDFVIRLQAALFGSVSIALAYKMGEILWTRKEGIIAAFLLATNTFHIHYSQEARSYSLMVFLALFSLVFLTEALRKNESRFWVGFILCTSLSLYNHYFAVLFLPAEVAYAACVIAQNWISYRRRNGRALESDASHGPSLPARQTLTFCLSLAVVGLTYLPWLPALQTHIAFFTGYQGGTAAAAGSLKSSLSFFCAILKEYSGISGVALLLWVGMLVLGLAACDLKRIALVAFWVGTPFVFLAVVQSDFRSKPRYVLFILPLLLLVIARGITSGSRLIGAHLLGSKSDRQWAPPIITALAVLAFASPSVAALRDYYPWQKEDWRGAAAFLQESMRPGDIIIADGQEYGRGGDAHRTVTGLRYYFSLWDEDVAVLYACQGLALRMRQETHAEAQVWGVLWHSASLSNLDQIDERIQIVEFPWVTIVKLTNPSGDRQEDATSILKALRIIQPSEIAHFDLYLALADIRREQGQTDQAAADLTRAESVRPEFPQAYIDLGNAYRDLMEPYKALAVYQQGLETGHHSAQLYLLLGETYLMTRSIRDSVTAFERALEIDPNNQEAQRTLQLLSGSPATDIPHPLNLYLGGQVALLGYDLRPDSVIPGGTVEITVWWQALQEMKRDYSTFIHVVGPENHILVQEDRLLEHNQLSTSQWRPGELVKNEHALRIPADAEPGEYTVIVGAYYWETGERLAVWNVQGRRIDGDAVSLTTLALED